MPIRHCLYFVTTLLLYSGLNAQPRTSTSPIIDTRYVDIIDNKASTLEKKLDRQSEKIIAQFLKQENKLRRKLARKDSAAAIAMLGDTKEQYNKLQQKLASTEKLKQYIPSLDTLSTSLKFLQ
jgi:DNA repair exonuclease SbcCD ATPase subunit